MMVGGKFTWYSFSWSILLASILLFSCDPEPKNTQTTTELLADSTYDDHSYSNLKKIRTTHLDLELDVNFDNKTIYGIARHTMENKGCDTAIFDIKGLQIQKITLGPKGHERETDFVIGNMDKDSILGQPLLVTVQHDTKQVNIYYQTTPQSDALDWLEPQQTSSKKHPFLYTQGQAILTRTWIPLQDSPSNRITYSAKVKVPAELMAVMSASNSHQKNASGEYHFEMEQAIPSYLIALGVGDLKYHAFDKRCGVFCEPQLMPACTNEFSDLPSMMTAAERLYGKYQWKQYDLLVLPYSFPFGGMENPRLTFVNPTVIAGDKSLVSVIAHELAHSWSGNLVTNRSWDDFWLNEGFTVYFEHRIMEQLEGKEIADILSEIEFYELKDEIKRIEKSGHPEDSRLVLDLEGRDPDDGMTDIAYVKGAYFLKTLEHQIGRKKMDAFLNDYFKDFAFKTVNTTIFENYLQKKLQLSETDFKAEDWFYKKGIPTNCIRINSPRLRKMEALADQFVENPKVLAPKKYFKYFRKRNGRRYKKMFIERIERKDHIVQEWMTFIRRLPQDIGAEKMRVIDKYLHFTSCGNSEIQTEWFILGIRNNYKAQRPKIEAFITKVGRRKYILPLYETLCETPENKIWAKEIFKKVKGNYHAVTRNSVEKLLKK